MRALPWPARSPGGAAELYAPAFPRTDWGLEWVLGVGGGAPGAPSRRGEAPPWPAGVGHGSPPPPWAFLAGAPWVLGVLGAGGARRRESGAAGLGAGELLGRRFLSVLGRQKQRREEASVRKKEGRREGEEKKEKEEFRGVLCKWFRLILLLC